MMNTLKNKMNSKIPAMTAAILVGSTGFLTSYADLAWGENAAKFVLGQMYWIALGFTLYFCLQMLPSRAWLRMLGVAVGGGIIAFTMKNPEILGDIGTKIMAVVNGG